MRPRRGIGAVLVLALGVAVSTAPAPAPAQTDPTIIAQRAEAMLLAANDALGRAEGARDRVAALTQTIRAFEEGLAATREALRRATTLEARLSAQLATEGDRLAAILSATQMIESAPPALLGLHPDGPLGAVHSGMMLAELTPALAQEAAALRDRLIHVQVLRDLQETTRADLAAALAAMQTARVALSEAIADRTDLPPRIDSDPDALRAIVAAATSLAALTDALAANPPGPLPDADRIDSARGTLPLPAFGEVLRGYREADAAGVTRPGMILATRPGALVTAPWAGAVRYAGAVPELGLVVILEPDARHLIILGGIGDLFVATGEIVPAGAALGLMGGAEGSGEELMITLSEGTGLSLSETLYIEVRSDNDPVDPAPWFRMMRDED